MLDIFAVLLQSPLVACSGLGAHQCVGPPLSFSLVAHVDFAAIYFLSQMISDYFYYDESVGLGLWVGTEFPQFFAVMALAIKSVGLQFPV